MTTQHRVLAATQDLVILILLIVPMAAAECWVVSKTLTHPINHAELVASGRELSIHK